MQRSTDIDITIPSDFDVQQVEDLVRRKLPIEPTDVVSDDTGVILTKQAQQSKKPAKAIPKKATKKDPGKSK